MLASEHNESTYPSRYVRLLVLLVHSLMYSSLDVSSYEASSILFPYFMPLRKQEVKQQSPISARLVTMHLPPPIPSVDTVVRLYSRFVTQ